MSIIDFQALADVPLAHDPYDHVLVPGLITSDALAAANRDFPAVSKPGSFPTQQLEYGPGFAALLEALQRSRTGRCAGRENGDRSA